VVCFLRLFFCLFSLRDDASCWLGSVDLLFRLSPSPSSSSSSSSSLLLLLLLLFCLL
jgi:hypothetical protein